MADDEVFEDEYNDEPLGDEQDQEQEDDGSLGAALTQQMGAAPWYVSSVAIHCVIFLFMLIFAPEPRPDEQPRVIINTEVVEEEEEEEEEEVEPEIEEKEPEVEIESDVIVETPVVTTTTVEVSDHFETDDNMDNNNALGDPDQVSDVDSEFQGTPALMGVGKSGGKGGGGRFGFRNGGGKKNAIRRGGGGKKTESAVDWALRWLAAHQEYDGHWDCLKYGGAGGHGGVGFDKSAPGDVAVTSLALLAFLGAGNSTKFGKYKTNVAKAVEWMKTQQLASGQIGRHRYEGGIAVMAICEAYGMSMNSDLKNVAQKAVDWACKSQCPSGGWDYAPTNAGRVDTSVAGWWIMGLKSAKVAGLSIPSETMDKALKYIQQATTDSTGSTSYSSSTADVNQVKRGGGSIRMTAVSMTCLQFLGIDRKDGQIVACANRSVGTLPNPGKFDFYNWYYQALGFFQMGVRDQWWKTFNPAMKTGLLTTQVREGTFEQNKGSWNPETDAYGPQWGRVGQTALGALMLEIYYRYKEVH